METLLEDPTFWVAVAFVVAVAIAARPLSKMILGALDRRGREIEKSLADARALNEEALELLASYQRMHREAEAEAAAIVERAREEAERVARTAADDLALRIEQRRQKALDRIRQAEADATRDVRDAAVDLALAATRRLLDAKLGDSEHARLVDEAIDEVGRRLH